MPLLLFVATAQLALAQVDDRVGAPGRLSVKTSGDGLVLSWEAPVSKDDPVTGYEISGLHVRRGTGIVLRVSGSTDADTTTWTDGQATDPDLQYVYRVRAWHPPGPGQWSAFVITGFERPSLEVTPEVELEPTAAAPGQPVEPTALPPQPEPTADRPEPEPTAVVQQQQQQQAGEEPPAPTAVPPKPEPTRAPPPAPVQPTAVPARPEPTPVPPKPEPQPVSASQQQAEDRSAATGQQQQQQQPQQQAVEKPPAPTAVPPKPEPTRAPPPAPVQPTAVPARPEPTAARTEPEPTASA